MYFAAPFKNSHYFLSSRKSNKMASCRVLRTVRTVRTVAVQHSLCSLFVVVLDLQQFCVAKEKGIRYLLI